MRRQAGFTLIELMVAIAVMAVLAAIAVPNMVSYRSNQRLGASAREVLGSMQDARMLAIKEGQDITLSFDTADGSYLIFADSGTIGADGNLQGANNGVLDGDEVSFSQGELPEDIRMTNASFAGGVPRIRFNFRGMATGFGGNVVLTNARGNALTVVLRGSGSAVIR